MPAREELSSLVDRTTVLVGRRSRSVARTSYRLFERCASGLNLIPEDRAREQRADVYAHRLFLIGADIAQR
jgi:hypothetical protein